MSNTGYNSSAIRKFFYVGNLWLSYLDYGGDSERVLVMLHGYMANARSFSELAVCFKDWRVIAMDQRGHGRSGRLLSGC
ncbi:alpha/beta fold hydrolase [Paenibacillus mendelii]|uniref:Alpha/beta fold hydrolase n=1 Tax=Paenibacillus mendelii TaxID=206163 RepID=A0ABV6JE96_9BACL